MPVLKHISDRALWTHQLVYRWQSPSSLRIPKLYEVRQSVDGGWIAAYDEILQDVVPETSSYVEVVRAYAHFQAAQLIALKESSKQQRDPLDEFLLDAQLWMYLVSKADQACIDERSLRWGGGVDAGTVLNTGRLIVSNLLASPLTVEPCCWSHGDLHAGNVMRVGNEIWVIDWDESYLAPYGAGIQALLWDAVQQSGESLSVLLEQAATIFNAALPDVDQLDADSSVDRLVKANTFSAVREMGRILRSMRRKQRSDERAGAYLTAWGYKYRELFSYQSIADHR